MGDVRPERVLCPGTARGELLVLEDSLSFWGGFDPAESMQRLQRMADEHGRSMQTLNVSVFGARPDADTLQAYRDAGIDRAILPLPPAPKNEVWKLLDRNQPLLDQSGGSA